MTERFIKKILAEELFGSLICESLDDKDIVDALYEDLMLEKLLYGEPVSIPELRKILHDKIVNFKFIKLNGEVRPARGTTMMKYIPPKDHPKGTGKSSDKVATFYDLDKDAWRSVSKRSREVVLKKDKGKPTVVVRDKDKEYEQGENYEYTTRKGEDTYVKILRKMDDGNYQVRAPEYGTTFAVPPEKLGDHLSSEDIEQYKETRAKEVPKEEEPSEEEPPEYDYFDYEFPEEGPSPAEEPQEPKEEEEEEETIIPREEEEEEEGEEEEWPREEEE